jgi:hypothetical protein
MSKNTNYTDSTFDILIWIEENEQIELKFKAMSPK